LFASDKRSLAKPKPVARRRPSLKNRAFFLARRGERGERVKPGRFATGDPMIDDDLDVRVELTEAAFRHTVDQAGMVVTGDNRIYKRG
jgi:hypothetical protein